jgi:uncharacterized membrane protein
MRWNRWYTFKSYLKSSLWLVPFFALLLQMVVSRITHRIGFWLMNSGRLDEQTGLLALSMPGARTLLETIVTLNMSFLVFTFGSLLVAIQVASGQFTPRIIATTLLRDNRIRYSVGFFVFTLLFSLRALTRMDTTVHQFNTLISGIFGALSLVNFLYLIDYAARMLRPISLVRSIGEQGIEVIKRIYPLPTTHPSGAPSRHWEGCRCRTSTHQHKSGIVLAIDVEGLVALAERVDGIIEFVPHVGDFIAVEEPLFRLYGGAEALGDHELRTFVAIGVERTMEQDPTFAFRILVDIALKALSPAINDPTTATLAIDQLHRLLLTVGKRHLRGEEYTDRSGTVRVVLQTPNWEDYVHLSYTEIRHCGAGSIQIARRMRSMGETLIQFLPEHRHLALLAELDKLDRSLESHFAFPEDLALARIPDAQGLGSSSRMKSAESVTDSRDVTE